MKAKFLSLILLVSALLLYVFATPEVFVVFGIFPLFLFGFLYRLHRIAKWLFG